jgi:hypothetical protein
MELHDMPTDPISIRNVRTPDDLARFREALAALSSAWEAAHALFASRVNEVLRAKPGNLRIDAPAPPGGLTWAAACDKLRWAVRRLDEFVLVPSFGVWLPSTIGLDLLQSGEGALAAEADRLSNIGDADARFWCEQVVGPIEDDADRIREALDNLRRAGEAVSERIRQTPPPPEPPRLRFDPSNYSVILDGTTFQNLHRKAFALLRAVAEANGTTCPGTQLAKQVHYLRIDRLKNEHLPEGLRHVIESSKGNEGGYWLHPDYVGRWSITST